MDDRTRALAYLRHVGGYRLKGYYFQKLDPETKRFPEGFSFEDVVRLYEFDCALRSISFQAIERIEVSIRTVMANHMSDRHGAHWFMDRALFQEDDRYWSFDKFSRKIKDETDRSRSRFVQHYKRTYDEPPLPPSWAVAECVSFGAWSLAYSHLSNTADKKGISVLFGVKEPEVFASWLHSLTLVRNAVAHHSRLVGAEFPRGVRNLHSARMSFADARSFYSAATVMNYILMRTRLPSRFKAALVELLSQYPDSYRAEIGFPAGWQEEPGWR